MGKRLLAALLPSLLLLPGFLYAADPTPVGTPVRVGGGGDSQINESSADDAGVHEGQRHAPQDLPGRLREYVEDSLAKYDQVKNEAVGFRKQGWYPSFFLREPERDVVLEPGVGVARTLSVHISFARRDIEQRMVVAPAERFVLPGADRRFLAELITALAAVSPEIGRVRLLFWFAVLQADGRMTWEYRGSLQIAAATARRFPPGARTPQTVWPVLEENSIPAALWPER